MKKLTFCLLIGTAVLVPGYAQAVSCHDIDCAALGYSKNDIKDCAGYIYCPFDTAYKICIDYDQPDTCGDKFFGISSCPDNASCTTCTIGGKTYMKTVVCQSSGNVVSADLTCEDNCPDDYVENVSQCGTTGANGWRLVSSVPSSLGGKICSKCQANTCSATTYPYTGTPNAYSSVCYPGDNTPRFYCSSATTYYNGRCVFPFVTNGIYVNGPLADCTRTDGYSCVSVIGKSISLFPVSAVRFNGSTSRLLMKDSRTYYHNYD